MADKKILTYEDIELLVNHSTLHEDMKTISRALGREVFLHPVPRGGVFIGQQLALTSEHVLITENAFEADAFIDDLVDSGETKARFGHLYPKKPFFALIDKKRDNLEGVWVSFPWEANDESAGIEDNIRRVLQFIGEDPKREGLVETPTRVAKAMEQWFAGYGQKPADVLKVFEDGAEGCDEMVVVKDIPFYSHCEHHMTPIFGTVSIGYIPNKKIVGISKLVRLMWIFARRLQVQERLTNQIAQALAEHLKPQGVAVEMRARHLCMESRGVEIMGAETVTSSVSGVFKTKPEARAEFFALVR